MSQAIRLTQALLKSRQMDIELLGRELDAMTHVERVGAVQAINGRQQARIWDAAVGRVSRLTDIVPEYIPKDTEVIHEGKNSLPVFTRFQKRFIRPTEDDSVLYGYNEGMTRAVVGPGYFVAEFFEPRGEVGVNYYKVPPAGSRLARGWPTIKRNEEGIQQLVYSKMIDYLRKVSQHVTIGRAYKHGEETPNYFLLARTD